MQEPWRKTVEDPGGRHSANALFRAGLWIGPTVEYRLLEAHINLVM